MPGNSQLHLQNEGFLKDRPVPFHMSSVIPCLPSVALQEPSVGLLWLSATLQPPGSVWLDAAFFFFCCYVKHRPDCVCPAAIG